MLQSEVYFFVFSPWFSCVLVSEWAVEISQFYESVVLYGFPQCCCSVVHCLEWFYYPPEWWKVFSWSFPLLQSEWTMFWVVFTWWSIVVWNPGFLDVTEWNLCCCVFLVGCCDVHPYFGLKDLGVEEA